MDKRTPSKRCNTGSTPVESSMKTFKMQRIEDVSGVSGIGIVAEGVIFTNGKCVITWFGNISSVVVYDSFEECEQIHGHEGRTKFIFDE